MVKCVVFMSANKVLQVVSTQRGPSIERGPDMRTLVKINFPNARTLQELEEDLCIECTSSASQHGLSWSRGTFHLRQRRMELEDLHENNIDEQAREELVRLKEGEKAY